MPSETPHGEYQKRLDHLRGKIRRLSRFDLAFSLLRFTVFLGGIIMIIAFLRQELSSPFWFLPLATAFILILVIHDRVIRGRQQSERAVEFYSQGLRRLENRWMGTGDSGTRYAEEMHPYAEDLDIFGRGSLYELLCTAKTRVGQAKLADWLKQRADPATLHARQDAVRELIPRLDLREDLAKIIEPSTDPFDSSLLLSWSAGPAVEFPAGWRILACVISVLAFTALVAWPMFHLGPGPFVLVIGPEFLLYQRFRKPIHHTYEFAEDVERELTAYHALLHRLERERFASPHLRALTASLGLAGVPASRRLRRLALLVTLLNDGKSNLAFRPIAGLLCWSIHFGWAIEHWRRKNGADVHQWVMLISEIEALCALAGFSFENPANVFPEIVSDSVEESLAGEGLGHPLLPEAHCVRNDLRLGAGASRLLIVSGSNMSGKSTFLRTVGISLVLAQAGAAVRARRLRFSPLAVYTSIRNQDSIQQGYSRFYMEIKHVQRVIEAASREPILFLIDEIFNGTNSHDRQIAADAIARRLAATGALGLITTHDLALTRIPEELPGAENVHFEDQIQDNHLVFDYKLHPGIIQRGNALALMRSIGLDV